jgi:hypothetical protein
MQDTELRYLGEAKLARIECPSCDGKGATYISAADGTYPEYQCSVCMGKGTILAPHVQLRRMAASVQRYADSLEGMARDYAKTGHHDRATRYWKDVAAQQQLAKRLRRLADTTPEQRAKWTAYQWLQAAAAEVAAQGMAGASGPSVWGAEKVAGSYLGQWGPVGGPALAWEDGGFEWAITYTGKFTPVQMWLKAERQGYLECITSWAISCQL